MTNVAIAQTTAADTDAALALLPEVWGMQVELSTARIDGELVGASALVWESWAQPAGFPVAVHVLPAARRRGVGRALLDAAAAAVGGETDGLWTLGVLDEATEAAAFLAACGFEARKRIRHYRMDTPIFDRHMTRIVDRLRRNNRIPPHIRVVPLRDAPLEPVARLVAAELGSGPVRLLQRMRRGLAIDDGSGIDFDRSTVVLDGDEVAGVLLNRWDNGYPAIEANVVAPAWRNSFVNALQLQVATRRGLEAGSTHFRFDCDETITDSMNLAVRGGGEPVAVEARFYRALAG